MEAQPEAVAITQAKNKGVKIFFMQLGKRLRFRLKDAG
jgi:hypothetical protein